VNKKVKRISNLVLIFVFFTTTIAWSAPYELKNNKTGQNWLRPIAISSADRSRKDLTRRNSLDLNKQQEAGKKEKERDLREIWALLGQLKNNGITAKLKGQALYEIADLSALCRHLKSFCIIKNLADIKLILQARLNIQQSRAPPPQFNATEAMVLYNSLFEQESLRKENGKQLSIVMFRGGRGASALTKEIKKKLPNVAITALISATDDGRSWFHAAQDFNATGIPDCGKCLLDLADTEREEIKNIVWFLGSDEPGAPKLRMKGEKAVLEEDFKNLIRNIQCGQYLYDMSGASYPLFEYAMKIEGKTRAELVKYLQAFQDNYKRKSQRFTFRNITMRSVVLVGAAWYLGDPDNPNWQEAADRIGKLLSLNKHRVLFATTQRQHLVGLTEDGTIYFTETGINENPQNAPFVGQWLMDQMPDIEGMTELLKDHGVELTSVEIGAIKSGVRMPGRKLDGKPITDDLQKEIKDTSRRIVDCTPDKLRTVIEIMSDRSRTANLARGREIIANTAAVKALENAGMIIYSNTTVKSNRDPALIVRGIRKAIEASPALKIMFANPTIESEPEGTTAADMVEDFMRCASEQQRLKGENISFDDTGKYLKYVIGMDPSVAGLDRDKVYIPFDPAKIGSITGNRIVPVCLDIERKQTTDREAQSYGMQTPEHGFYEPPIMVETITALEGLRRVGRGVTAEGRLVCEDLLSLIVDEYKPAQAADLLIKNYPAKQQPYIFENISNELKTRFLNNPRLEPSIRQFYRIVQEKSLSHTDGSVSEALQVMAQQALNIVSWIKEGVPEAEEIEITADEDEMYISDNGKSYLKAKTLLFLDVSLGQNNPGFFYEGGITFEAFGRDAALTWRRHAQYHAYDRKKFKAAAESMIMAVKTQGFIRVPDAIKDAATEGKISPIRQVSFIHDFIPGSILTAATDLSHYQGRSVGIRHIIEGTGLGFNILYGKDGTIKRFLVQELDASDPKRCFAITLPGYVSCVVNTGGLNFYEVSIEVDDKTARAINPEYDETHKDAIENMIAKQRYPPYLTVFTGGEYCICKTTAEELPDPVYINGPADVLEPFIAGGSLVGFYQELTPPTAKELTDKVAGNINTITSDAPKHKTKLIDFSKAHQRIKAIKNCIRQISAGIIETAPAAEYDDPKGLKNRMGIPLPLSLAAFQEKPYHAAALRFNAIDPEYTAIIPGTEAEGLKPITLEELVSYYPEMLGSAQYKDYHTKVCIVRKIGARVGLNSVLNMMGTDTFVVLLQNDRRLAYEVMAILNKYLKTDNDFLNFAKQYGSWESMQDCIGWRKTGEPYFTGETFNDFTAADREALNGFLRQMRLTRAEIANVFNRIDQLGPDKVILTPARHPHNLDGQALHVHAVGGKPVLKSHAWIAMPIEDATGEDCLVLVIPQLASETTYYIADFSPWIYDRNKKSIVMKSKFTDQEVKNEAELIEAECAAIAKTVSKYIAAEVTDTADYVVTPHVIKQIIDPVTGKVAIEQRELVKGPYPLWLEEAFTASRITFYDTSTKQTRIDLWSSPAMHKEIIVLKGRITVEVNGATKELKANTSAIVSATAGSNRYYICSDGEAEVIILHRAITQNQKALPNFNAPSSSFGSWLLDVATRTRSIVPPSGEQTPIMSGNTHKRGAFVTRRYKTRGQEEPDYTIADPQERTKHLLQILGQMA